MNLLKTKLNANNPNNDTNNNHSNIEWSYITTGVPLLILDYGLSKARTKRCIKIVLAERGSCFPLFQDILDHLTDYKVSQQNLHTFHVSSNHSIVMAFEFQQNDSASRFWSKVEQLMSMPENLSLSVPGKKQQIKKKLKYFQVPDKETISQPCCFKHLISVDKSDDYFSLQEFVMPKSNNIILI